MNVIKKYSWTFDKRDNIWTSDTFDTVKECVEDAKKYIELNKCAKGHKSIFIGENHLFEPYVDAADVLELIENSAYDQCGEVANDWYSYDAATMKTELAELSCKITAIVKEWLKKYNREPFFYSIIDVHEVALDTEFEEETSDKPEICDTCDREEHCGLQEECCDESGKVCDNHIPEGKAFLDSLNLGDAVFTYYEYTEGKERTVLIRHARFAGTHFDGDNLIVQINYNDRTDNRIVSSLWVDADKVFKNINDILAAIGGYKENTTIHFV
jgi:hypothetical protein